MAAATRNLVTCSSLLAAAALWACCAMPLIMSTAAAAEAATTALPAGGGVPAPTEVAATWTASAALPPSTATATAVAADTSSKKIPLEGEAGPHEEYVPAAEVASALPVPIPDGNPVEGAFAGGGLGGNQAFFPGSSGYGTAAGLGGFGQYGYGGGPGGLGPGTYGYNGPLYFNSAPRRSGSPAGSCAAAAVLLVLWAAMYMMNS
ncbi:hypothetical protein E2562_008063 [Oryza meyeriana var. granulata]|uniref:Uncharacterized protein n=1 Tax=Oryza meyeriana var. granulata TaxID=110450 RepID=A0A6G1DFX2_9ORYZ|nr:hypothetical protein E2562_008063 [Oryza meyeriana var. granulata]